MGTRHTVTRMDRKTKDSGDPRETFFVTTELDIPDRVDVLLGIRSMGQPCVPYTVT